MFVKDFSDFVCRLESGNSIEEKLLKNGTKDLIREVAAQGTDYTLAFLTQVRITECLFILFCSYSHPNML